MTLQCNVACFFFLFIQRSALEHALAKPPHAALPDFGSEARLLADEMKMVAFSDYRRSTGSPLPLAWPPEATLVSDEGLAEQDMEAFVEYKSLHRSSTGEGGPGSILYDDFGKVIC